jgi:hypothetical protein
MTKMILGCSAPWREAQRRQKMDRRRRMGIKWAGVRVVAAV